MAKSENASKDSSRRSGKNHGTTSNRGGRFELFFWGAVFVAATLYFLFYFIPGIKNVDEAEAARKSRKAALVRMEGELERKESYVGALSETPVNVNTLERELRTKFGWRARGERLIPTDYDTSN